MQSTSIAVTAESSSSSVAEALMPCPSVDPVAFPALERLSETLLKFSIAPFLDLETLVCTLRPASARYKDLSLTLIGTEVERMFPGLSRAKAKWYTSPELRSPSPPPPPPKRRRLSIGDSISDSDNASGAKEPAGMPLTMLDVHWLLRQLPRLQSARARDRRRGLNLAAKVISKTRANNDFLVDEDTLDLFDTDDAPQPSVWRTNYSARTVISAVFAKYGSARSFLSVQWKRKARRAEMEERRRERRALQELCRECGCYFYSFMRDEHLITCGL